MNHIEKRTIDDMCVIFDHVIEQVVAGAEYGIQENDRKNRSEGEIIAAVISDIERVKMKYGFSASGVFGNVITAAYLYQDCVYERLIITDPEKNIRYIVTGENILSRTILDI